MRRIKELDAIRGLAVIAIVVFHLWLPQFGWLGYAVDLFFVLSGYLITTIILGNTFDGRFLLSFYARRALRIWPIYYLALLAVILVNPLRHASPGSLADLPYYLTFTQEIRQWLGGAEPSFPLAFRHTWTLAIEEQFYILWPALLGVVGRSGLPWASAVLIASAVIARALGADMFVLATHTDSLALGGLLAALIDQRQEEPGRAGLSPSRLAALGIVSFLGYGVAVGSSRLGLTLPVISSRGFEQALKPLCVATGFFSLIGLIVTHAGHRALGWLRGGTLVYLGSISFGIYLYHHIIIKYAEEYLAAVGRQTSFGVELAEFGASLGLAALSWKYVERPMLGLKDHFRYESPGPGESGRSIAVPELVALELGRG